MSLSDPCSSRTCADGSPRCFATALRRPQQSLSVGLSQSQCSVWRVMGAVTPTSLPLTTVSTSTGPHRLARERLPVQLNVQLCIPTSLLLRMAAIERHLCTNHTQRWLPGRQLHALRHAQHQRQGSGALCERERVELVGRRGLRRHVRQLERRQHPEEDHHHELRAHTCVGMSSRSKRTGHVPVHD